MPDQGRQRLPPHDLPLNPRPSPGSTRSPASWDTPSSRIRTSHRKRSSAGVYPDTSSSFKMKNSQTVRADGRSCPWQSHPEVRGLHIHKCEKRREPDPLPGLEEYWVN